MKKEQVCDLGDLPQLHGLVTLDDLVDFVGLVDLINLLNLVDLFFFIFFIFFILTMEKSREAKKAREEKLLLEVKALQMQVRVRFFNKVCVGQTRKYFETQKEPGTRLMYNCAVL